MDLEGLKDIMAINRSQKEADADDVEHGECWNCYWHLSVNSDGVKSCPICERVFK